jgi:hypothetical protein
MLQIGGDGLGDGIMRSVSSVRHAQWFSPRPCRCILSEASSVSMCYGAHSKHLPTLSDLIGIELLHRPHSIPLVYADADATVGAMPRLALFGAGCLCSELQGDGIDTSLILRAGGHPSPFTYIIVDREGEPVTSAAASLTARTQTQHVLT